MFGSLAWSPNNEKFIYVSEKKFSEDLKGFSKYAEKENFGERLQNVKEPVLCLLNIKSLEIEVIDPNQLDQLNSCFIAQPAFIDDESIVFMGIKVGAKKLGMTYIYCRPTSIYTMNLATKLIGNLRRLFRILNYISQRK